MIRKFAALVPFVAMFVGAADVHAIPTQPYGTKDREITWNLPKVAPRTACKSLMLYAADKPADASKMHRYRFTGECTMNVANAKQQPVMRTADVLIDAEWFPAMKRASERVVVKHPDLGVEFTTWATCDANPFTANGVACRDRGMGANKFDAYISKDDVPFASNRATAAQVDAADKAVGTNASKLFQNPSITRVRPVGAVKVGEKQGIWVDVAGGAGLCPMELDFGDGTKQKLIVWAAKPFEHYIEHTFTKPAASKVSARALPGCAGEGAAFAIVK